METEDIIELGSSDEEPGPPPPKKINVRNAMVHIPTKFHGVTIKPVKANSTELPKLGKNITITKTTSSPLTSKVRPPDKPLEKLAVSKKKAVAKKFNQMPQTKGKVFNPLSQAKKGIVHSVGNSTITKLKTPIIIKKPQINRPQPLQRLPPSITIKKTGTVVKPSPKIIVLPKTIPKLTSNVSKKRKIEEVQTVELDDDEASTSNNPQWYVRPEDQTRTSTQENNATTQEGSVTSQEKAAISQEDTNNKEPEGPKYIEITIEDSPIKPAKTKRTRELSTEKVITIDDSPNKGSVISDDIAGASDSEAKNEVKIVKKIPHSKKKLNYASDLQSIEENRTIEIEIEPMERTETNMEMNKESRVVCLTPDIMEVDQTSVEIAQNKQGAVSVVQIKPLQSSQNSKSIPNRDVATQSEFHPIYQSFISLCIQLENSNDMEKIIEKKIKTYYRQVPKEYTESEEFLDMVSSKITAMKAAPEKMYLYIKDIVDELNLQRKFMKQVPAEDKSKDQDSFLYGKENELDPNKQRQIRKLEKTLKKLNRAIQKLENQEVDFDDEEDSVYLLTEKYKERMVRVHAKFCQLTNTKMPSQPRLVLDPRPGLSAAPAKRLEAWINKKDGVVFPDFHDVLRCVREANEADNLGWNEACIMEEARDLFVRCGKKLQRRRQENEWRLATSRITPNSDPAEQSEELKKQLEANRRLANTKETEVFNKFCDRQSLLKLEAEEIDDKEAEESPVESEEEDNDEISSLESKQKRKERLRRLLHEQSKKTISNKVPQTEENVNKEIENDEHSVESITENNSENEEDKIQTLSDDSNEIGSDMDELHLLQKLRSDNEICTGSPSDSDSETPIAISDSLNSSSDDEKQTKQQLCDVISIENSSYSDESDSKKNNELKKNKKHIESSKELIQESKEIEGASSSVKKTHCKDPILVNTVLTSSGDESNPDDNINSRKSDNSSKVSSLKEGRTRDKDFELSIMSENAELCINVNDYSKIIDAEDEQSTNSDIMPGSSTSSGQYEELLKEHNADPLLKQPDLIPQDPSDKLFDSLVIKHYNDPLVKKHLKGSDSSNDGGGGDDPENSNSDTQSTNGPETVEEVKKDLIESSVDTEELLNSNSPSVQIVDKFIENLKQSEGSQSSDELLMKVDQELGLMSEATSPVTFALEKEVNLARQTKAWPRFKDECSSLSSADDDNTGEDSQLVPTKPNESTKNNFDGMEIATNVFKAGSPAAKNTEAMNYESTKCESEETDVNQTENNSNDAKTKKNSAVSKEASPSDSGCTKNVLEGMDVEYSATGFTEESNDAVASSSGCTEKHVSVANTVSSFSQSPKGKHESMDIIESGIARIEAKDCSFEQTKEIDSKELITNVVSPGRPDDANEILVEHEGLGEVLKSHKIPEGNSSKADNTLMDVNHKPEDGNDNSNELVSNGNLNINMDISELLDCNTNVSQKRDGGDKGLDDLNNHLSAEKGDCGNEEAIPRTITSTCFNCSEGND